MDAARDAIHQTLSRVKTFLAQESPPKLSEADTKAHFIEPIIAALGWEGIGVVAREYYVKNSQEFIDYVMRGQRGPLLAVEVKPLQTDLTDKHAAQLIQYCAVEGIEWAALTNGRELQVFNTFLKPDLAAKRVLRLDLLAFNTDAEFDGLLAQIWQLSREQMTQPTGVRSWLHQRRLDAALRKLLADPASAPIRHLRKALRNLEIDVTPQELATWFRTHLGPAIPTIPVPVERAAPPTTPASPAPVRLIGDAADQEPLPKRQRGRPPKTPIPPTEAESDRREQELLVGRSPQVVALYRGLRRRIDDQLPETAWRATSLYVAAESAGHTFLAVQFRADHLIVGLTLPAELTHPRITDNAGHFSWGRMKKVARIWDEAAIDEDLLALVRQAQEHAPSLRRRVARRSVDGAA